MQHNLKLKLRIFSFLLVCALFLPLEGMTAFAEQPAVPEVQTAAAYAVVPGQGAAVLESTEIAPAPLLRSADPGYIERHDLDPAFLQTVVDGGAAWAEVLLQQQMVLDILHENLGTPYVYGGAWPGGFDCSGIVYYIYHTRLGYDITRCADTQLLYDGVYVSRDELLPGDLVCFRDPASPWAASHIGIYVGDRMMIHASCSRGLTYDSIDKYYYSSCFVGAKRILRVDDSRLSRLDFSQFAE